MGRQPRNEGDARRPEAIIRLCARATEIDPGYARAWGAHGPWQVNLRFALGEGGDGGLLGPVLEKFAIGFLNHTKDDPDFITVRDNPRFKGMIAAAEARLAAENGSDLPLPPSLRAPRAPVAHRARRATSLEAGPV
jgi:hypothetical protein